MDRWYGRVSIAAWITWLVFLVLAVIQYFTGGFILPKLGILILIFLVVGLTLAVAILSSILARRE